MALRRFLYSSFDSPTSLLGTRRRTPAPALGRLLTRSLENHVAASFSDNRLRQVLGYPAVFLGSSPSRAPSMYHLMSRLDLGDRVLYPQGGFTRLIGVIADLAEKHGARLHTGAEVTAIATTPAGRGPAPGSRASSTSTRRRAACSRPTSSSAPPTCTTSRPRCCPPPADPPRAGVAAPLARAGRGAGDARRRRRAAAAGRTTRCSSPPTGGRTSATSSDGRPVPEPASIYVCKPSATDPSVAPAGSENLFVLVPVPADTAIGARWRRRRGAEEVERTADAAIDLVADWAGVPDLRERIRVRHTVGPQDFADALPLLARRCARAGAHPAPERVPPARQRLGKVDGLLYAGSTHDPRGRPADVPDQRRAGAQAALRRPLEPCRWHGPMSLLQWSYVAMLAFCLAGTLPLVPAFRLRVLRQPRRLLLTISLAGTPFLLWDLYATHAGHWWFDADQTLPWRVAGRAVRGGRVLRRDPASWRC